MKKIITVFGSSKPVNNEEQYLTAYNLGKQLALSGFDICTGGFNGIMEAASKGAVEGGAEAIGVTVNLWSSRTNKYVTKEIVCDTLFERIDKLIELVMDLLFCKEEPEHCLNWLPFGNILIRIYWIVDQ